MNKVVKMISHFVSKYDNSLNISGDILEYSITLFLESFIVVLSFIGFSLFFDCLDSGVTLLITLVLVRNFFGGGHASSFKSCFCLSNAAFVSVLLIIPYTKEWSVFSLVFLLIISVFLYTVRNENIVKNLLFTTLGILSVIMVLANIFWGYYLIASCFLTALADLIFGKGGGKNEQEDQISKNS